MFSLALVALTLGSQLPTLSADSLRAEAHRRAASDSRRPRVRMADDYAASDTVRRGTLTALAATSDRAEVEAMLDAVGPHWARLTVGSRAPAVWLKLEHNKARWGLWPRGRLIRVWTDSIPASLVSIDGPNDANGMTGAAWRALGSIVERADLDTLSPWPARWLGDKTLEVHPDAIAWGDLYYQLATSSASLTRQCLAGDNRACGIVFRLVPAAGPASDSIPPTVTNSARASLAAVTLYMGGDSSLARFTSPSQAVRKRIEFAAKVSLDSVFSAWRARVVAARPVSTRVPTGSLGAAALWIGVLMLIALGTARARVALVGVVLLTAGCRAGAPDQLAQLDPETISYYRSGDALRRTVTAWSFAEELDSLRARLRASPSRKPIEVILRGSFPDVLEPALNRYMTTQWKRLGETAPGVSVVVYVYDAEKYRLDGWNLSTFQGELLPGAIGDSVCVVMLPEWGRTDSLRLGQRLLGRWGSPISACANYALFGLPGKGIRQWLAETEVAHANSLDWVLRPTIVRARGGVWFTEAFSADMWNYGSEKGPWWATVAVMMGTLSETGTPPYMSGRASGIACLAGRAGACESLVVSPVAKQAAFGPHVVDRSPTWSMFWQQDRFGDVARPVPFLLSDLVRTFGREKVRSFWQSDLSVQQAFEQTFGLTLDHWVHGWATRHRGNPELGLGSIRLGATFDIAAIGGLLLWSGLLLAFAMATARTRRSGEA